MYNVGLDPKDGSILSHNEPYTLPTSNHHDSPMYRRLAIVIAPIPSSSTGVESEFWCLELTSTQSLHLTPFALIDATSGIAADWQERSRFRRVAKEAVDTSRFAQSTRTDLGPRADRDRKTVLLSEQLQGEYTL